MKIVKYEKDNCPGCVQVKEYCEAMNYEFDEVVDAVVNLTAADRKRMKMMSVPTVILYDDNGSEIDRVVGPDADKLDAIFEKRGA